MPGLAQREGRSLEMWQALGILNPGDRYVGDRYVLHLSTHPPQAVDGASSPWGGMSGAAVFCGDLLAGVIAADVGGLGHSALEAVPSYVLLQDEAFRTILAKYGAGARSELEPIEWQGISERVPPAPTPAALLRADQQTVPFHGREETMAQLRAWCGEAGFSVRLLHGPAGQGKTRLAHELAADMASERWATLWLRHGAAGEECRAALQQVSAAALVIVDYAESRLDQVQAVLAAAEAHHHETPFKVLLLARTAGDWWEEQLPASSPVAEALTTNAVAIEVPPLHPDSEDWAPAYEQAVKAFSSALPSLDGYQRHNWSDLAAGMKAPAANREGYDHALTLQMHALVDLLDAAEPTPAAGAMAEAPLPLPDRLLVHERRHWERSASARGLYPSFTMDTLSDALAVAFLVGSDTPSEADSRLRTVHGLSDQLNDSVCAVRDWIASLYPPSDSRPFGSLQPDLLAEHHVGIRLMKNPGLAERLVPDTNEAHAIRLLTVYSRSAARSKSRPTLSEHLTDLCVRHWDHLAGPAAITATQVQNPDPLVKSLLKIADDALHPSDGLLALYDQLPHTSQVLADFAVRLTERVLHLRRQEAQVPPETQLSAAELEAHGLRVRENIAESLCSLSGRLSALGRREEALEASREAVKIRRILAKEHPEVFLPLLSSALHMHCVALHRLRFREEALAASREAVDTHRAVTHIPLVLNLTGLIQALTHLAVMLGELGFREEALEVSSEAVKSYRILSRDHPENTPPELCSTLDSHALRLRELGYREEALDVSLEAVESCRSLAAENPDSYLPMLAVILHNHSRYLSDMGRRAESLAVIHEATRIRRGLAKSRPDAFLPDLADSVGQLSQRLGELGRLDEALDVVCEAADIYRDLTRDRPTVHLPALAITLNNQSVRLSELGRLGEALEVSHEAVGIYRTLAQSHPDTYLPELARFLINLANRLGQLKRHEESLDVGREAAKILRGLAEASPAAYLPDLGLHLNNHSIRLNNLGRSEEALSVIREAVHIRRGLVDDNPQAFLPDLAMSLSNLSADLGEVGHHTEALEAIHESVRISRSLVKTDSGAFLPTLAMGLIVLSDSLRELGHYTDAIAAANEAIDIHRSLALTHPPAYLPKLAISMEALCDIFMELREYPEAINVIADMTRVHEALAETDPAVHLPKFAACLFNLSAGLANYGRKSEALAVISKAVPIYRALAAQDPRAYGVNLQKSLRLHTLLTAHQ